MAVTESSVSFPAFGGTAVVAVSDPAALAVAQAAAERTVAEFDQACSRFRDDSELTALNASAGNPVVVSPLLLDAVDAAMRAAQLTDGDVDPTIGAALVALGYDRDFTAVAERTATAAERTATATERTATATERTATATVSIASVPGWRTIRLDRAAGTVQVPQGVTLDLGATSKALAADRAAALAAERTGCGVLVSLSGDLAIAGGSPPDGWSVRVTDDHRSGPDAPGQWIRLRQGGLATSSTTVRSWQTPDGDAHHLLDPASGAPARSVWRTVSVSAASCLDANTASTAAIVRGEPAIAWLESLGLPARLVSVDGEVTHVAGWPSAGDDLS